MATTGIRLLAGSLVVATTSILAYSSWQPAGPAEVQASYAASRYGDFPLVFEANQGQTDPRVDFISRGSGYTLFLTPSEAVFRLNPPSDSKAAPAVVRMSLVAANPDPVPSKMEPQPGKSQYLTGNDASQWRHDVEHFAKVKYADVYPGIDLVYYGNQKQLEYDFIVAPGMDPTRIGLRLEGAERVELDAHGNLVMQTTHGSLVQHKPVVYQDINGARRSIEGNYRLLADNRIGFDIGRYDAREVLVIDPVLAYGTYFGGSAVGAATQEAARAIAVDKSGNAYIAGWTASTDFPRRGAIQNIYGGGSQDAFVTKINPSGSAVVYSTFLGGSNIDSAESIAVDEAGNAYVAGSTDSGNFPTVNPAQATLNATRDGFVAKLNVAGNALVYSTYLGGNSFDTLSGIAVDSGANAYVIGTTNGGLTTTAGAYDTTYNGSTDAFVAKLNSSGSRVYATYLGGSTNADYGISIAVDAAGNTCVAGLTLATNFPTTVGALQASKSVGSDIFIAKLNPAGSALQYSTYLGGNGDDTGAKVALGPLGNIHVSAQTTSTNFPMVNALQPIAPGGARDGIVAKLNASGNALAYSTYLGGGAADYIDGIAVDRAGNAYVTGYTLSTDFPYLHGPGGPALGSNEVFAAKYNAAGSAVLYNTFLGYGYAGYGSSPIALDLRGSAHVTGFTYNSLNLSSPLQASPSGSGDAFISKVSVSPESAWHGDFNGDGLQDILWRDNVTGANTIWRSGNSSTFQAVSTLADQAWQVAGIGDFNGDGVSDILWRNLVTGANTIWRSANSATVQAMTGVTGMDWQILGAGDFDGDGVSDVLWRNVSTGINTIWRSANGATQIAVGAVPNQAWQVAAIGDFNGDARDDLVWRNLSTGVNSLWRSATAASSVALTTQASQAWQVVGAADFTGDGRSDLLWRNSVTGANTLWPSANGASPSAVTGVTNQAWRVVGVGDYNGDGRSDALWRNTATGVNAIWRSGNSATQQAVTAVTNLSWTIKS